jgi:hypothetical protein
MLALLLCLAPPLVAEREVVDRGVVRVGPPLIESFRLTNASDRPLAVVNVSSTCGCLAPRLAAHELAPGESTLLTIEINTLSQPAGPVNWTARVGYRCGSDSGELVLTLRAQLVAEVRVEPAAVAFHVKNTRSVTLTVTDTRDRPFRVTAVGTSSPRLTAELAPRGEDPRVRYIRLTATSDGPPGTQVAAAWLTTDDPLYPQIRVPVTVVTPARQRVTASPSSVVMSAGGSVLVQLRDRDGQPVVVERVEAPASLAARWAAGPGPLATLRVSQAAVAWDRKAVVSELRVHLREPAGEVVAIPVER